MSLLESQIGREAPRDVLGPINLDVPLTEAIRANPRIDRQGLNANVGPTISLIQESIPEFGRLGGPRLLYEIKNSDDDNPDSVLNRITQNFMDEAVEQGGLQQMYAEDSQRFETDFRQFRDNIRNAVSRESYTGEDINTSIARRSLDLRVERLSSKSTVGLALTPAQGFEDRLSPERLQTTSRVADSLGVDHKDLLALMMFETSGTFDPKIRNQQADSTATGLIQFLESTAQELGTSTKELAKMDFDQQMEYVEKYFQNRKRQFGPITNLKDLYMAVLWPAAIGKDESEVLWSSDRREYQMNRGLDTTGKGYITVGDAVGQVRRRREENEFFVETSVDGKKKIPGKVGRMNIPHADYARIISQNPERYRNLVDVDGRFKYQEEEQGRKEFEDHLRAHPHILDRLESDRVGDFMREVSKTHNVSSIVENNPQLKAQAFAVYDRFGSEGLTQFFNFYEEYDPEIPRAQQNQKFIRASNFLQRERVDGYSAKDWIQIYMGAEGSPVGKFRIQPIEESVFSRVQFPKAWNSFTANFYDFDVDNERFYEKDERDQLITLYQTFLDREPDGEELDSLTATTSEEYEDLMWEIRRKANPQYLSHVLMAHGRYSEEKGHPRYVIEDPEDQPLHVRLALDALRTMNEYEHMFYRSGTEDNQLVFEPDRAQRLRAGDTRFSFSPARAMAWALRTETVPVKDEEGNIIDMEEVPATGFWNQYWNTAVTGNIKAYEFTKRFFLDPAAYVIQKGVEAVDEEAGMAFEAFWDETFGEWDAFQMDSMFSFRQNTIPRLNMLAMDFASFFGAFKAYGTAGVWTASKFAKKVNDIAKGRELARVHLASNFGKTGRDFGKWENALNRSYEALSRGGQASRKLVAAQMTLGDALIQPVTKGDIGFFKHGLLGEEAEEWYKRSNYFTRTFSDIAFNSVVGFAFDSLLSSRAAVRAVSKADTGDKLSAFYRSMFTKDGDSYYAEFLNFMSEASNAIPEGLIVDSAANAFRGRGFLLDRSRIASLSDMVYAIKHDASGYLSTIRDDIRNTLRHYDIKFTGKVRPNLDESVNRIFDESMDSMARQLANVMREKATNKEGFSGIFTLGRLFQEHSGQLREVVEVNAARQAKGRLYDLAEANAVALEGPNRVVRREMILDAENRTREVYRVYESVDEDWAFELGRRLKRLGTEDESITPVGFGSEIEAAVKRRVADVEARTGREVTASEREQISTTVGEVFGAPYLDPRQPARDPVTGRFTPRRPMTGHVTDHVDGDRFIVRLDDGQLVTTTVRPSALRLHFQRQLDAGDINRTEFDRLVAKYGADGEDVRAWGEYADAVEAAGRFRDNLEANLNASDLAAADEMRRASMLTYLRTLTKNMNDGLERVNTEPQKLLPAPTGELKPFVAKTKKKAAPRDNHQKDMSMKIDEQRRAKAAAKAERQKRIAEGSYEPTKWAFSNRVLEHVKRFGGKTVKLTRDSVTNLARNLGVDTEAALRTAGPKGQRLLGINKRNIVEWKPGAKANKGLLVQTTPFEGVPRIFRANKRTELEPTRWIKDAETGKLRKNPDWDQLNQNVTMSEEVPLRTFVKDQETGLYRPARPTDEGQVFLNIQHPFKRELVHDTHTMKQPYGSFLDENAVFKHQVDAIEFTVDGAPWFRLIDENSQAVAVEHAFADNMHIATKVRTKKTAKGTRRERPAETEMVDTPEGLPEGVRVGTSISFSDAIEGVKEAGFRGGIAGALLGGMTGSVAAGLSEELEAQTLGSWGSAIGLIGGLLAGRRTRAAAGRVVRTAQEQTETVITNVKNRVARDEKLYDPDQKRALELDRLREKRRDNPEYAGDIREAEEFNLFTNFRDGAYTAFVGGRDAVSYMLRSRFTQSAFQALNQMSPTSRDVGRLLHMIEGEPRKLLANVPRIFEAKNGQGSWQRVHTEFNEFATEFLSQRGINVQDPLYQRMFGAGNTAYRQWNDAAYRVLHSDAKLAQGKLVNNGTQTVMDVYSGINGAIYREFDEAMLANPKFVDFIESIRAGVYRPVRQRKTAAYRSLLDNEITALEQSRMATPEEVAMLRRFSQTNDSYNTFKGRLSTPEEKATLKKAVENNRYGEVVREIQASKSKFTDMGDAYVTQLYSRSKMVDYERRWIRNYMQENPDVPREQAVRNFEEHAYQKFARLNEGKKGRRILRQFNEDTGDIEPITAPTRGDLREKLNRIIQDMSDEERLRLTRNLDDLIEHKGVRHVPDETGRVVAEDVYGIRELTGSEVEAFNRYNETSMRELYANVKGGIIVKNSNFLENPRSFQLPMEWTETDIDVLLRRYTRDVGPRLTWMEHGVYNARQFDRNYISKIRRELAEQGMDEHEISRLTGRVKGIYNMMTGILNKSDINAATTQADRRRQVQRMINAEKISSTIRNANFIPFGYFISVYDTFQPFIHGAALSSLGSMGHTTRAFLTNRQALRNSETISKYLDASMRKIEAYKPNFQRDFLDPVAGESPFDRGLGRLDAALTRGADLSARISFTKGIASVANRVTGGMWDVSMDNWGLLRLAFDDFYGVNSVSTTMNWYAGLIEARKLGQVYKEFMKNPDATQISGMSRQDVIRKFEMLGISNIQHRRAGEVASSIQDSKLDRFIRNMDEWEELVTRIGSPEEFDMRWFDQRPEFFNDLADIVAHMTDSYHGKSRMFRPETWSSNIGRVLSQYQIYPFNFSMQHYNRRVAHPLRNWNQQFGSQVSGTTELGRIVYHMSRNNRRQLREMGLTDEAIDAFPLEAYRAIIRNIYAVSASAGMFISRDAVMDIMEYPLMDEEETWRRMRRRGAVNPNAPQEDQKTWAQLLDGSGFESPRDFFTYLRGMAGYAARAGTFGNWGALVDNSRLNRDGIVSLTIAGSTVQQFAQAAGRTLDSDPGDMAITASKEALDLLLRRGPVMGSLSGWRNPAMNIFQAELNKPKNQNIRFFDDSSGAEIDKRLLGPAFYD